MANTRSQAGLMPGMTLVVVQVPKTLSQRVFVSSMAISQEDRIAVFRCFGSPVVSYAKWYEHGGSSTATQSPTTDDEASFCR